jgi:hypothetical protein
LFPLTVDGLIVAASMLILDANRRNQPVPVLARWCLGTGITATIGANVAHGLGHGPIGALVSAWPALALAGSFELLMTLVRTSHQATSASNQSSRAALPLPTAMHDVPTGLVGASMLNEVVRTWNEAGRSQRAIARELGIDRRKVKRILEQAA